MRNFTSNLEYMCMKALVGYAMLFIAVGMLVSYFISGFCEFLLVVIMLLGAYLLLCKC